MAVETFKLRDISKHEPPSEEQLAEIAVTTAKTFRTFFDAEPRVAMISFSTKSSASHPLIQKVKRAVQLAHERAPDLAVDGELQVDAALIPGWRKRMKHQPAIVLNEIKKKATSVGRLC